MDHALLIVLVLAMAGCASSTPSIAPSASTPPSPTTNPTTATTPTLSPTATPSSTTAPTPASTPSASPARSCAATTLASLSRTQRIGQLFAVGLSHNQFGAAEARAVKTSHIGSWWFTEKTSAGVDAIRDVADEIQADVSKAATGGVGFFVAANQEGGRIQALSGPGFDRIPSAITQGTWSSTTLRQRAERWGRQLLDAGVNLDFAPVADVVPKGTAAHNAPIGQLEREYGSDPRAVARSVVAFVEGMSAAGVATTAKHFPGLGRVAQNTDFSSDVVDTVTTRDDAYLTPFQRAVEAGVPAVMLSLATYERIDADRLAVFSWPIIGGILEDELGFGGIVMSDSLSAEAVSAIPAGTRAVAFLDDGGDMIVVRPIDVALEMVAAIEAHAKESAWFRRRIDNAALHVLRAKEAAGLLPCAD